MQYDFVVVGANGMQGRIAARDLLESGHSVLLCANDDYKMEKLLDFKSSEFALIDLRRLDRVKRILKKSAAPVVVNCAIDDYNLAVSKVAFELGMNYLDLGSEEGMTAGQLALDKDFKEKGLLGITGIGSTPGINNIMLRYVRPQFDEIHTVHLGFAWDSNLRTFVPPFSLDAITYEFVDKAKVLENGKFVERSPDEADVDYYYKSIGKQRTCYTKHIEHHTFRDYLKDAGIKTIKVYSSFPPHSYNVIQMLIQLGFLNSKEVIEFEGKHIKVLDFTAEVLRRLPIPEGYEEKENVWLKVFGKKDGKEKTVEMDCVAGTLPGWEDATCNVDTGMPASILAQMIKNGTIPEKGFFAPEFVVPPEPFFAELGKRKISIYENGKKIN